MVEEAWAVDFDYFRSYCYCGFLWLVGFEAAAVAAWILVLIGFDRPVVVETLGFCLRELCLWVLL